MAIDLDEARAARREERGEAPKIIFEGTEFTLPVELPIEAVAAISALAKAGTAQDGDAVLGALQEVAKSVLGEGYETFMAHAPSIADLSALVQGLPAEYGLGLGESSASEGTSENTTDPPKQPSEPATA